MKKIILFLLFTQYIGLAQSTNYQDKLQKLPKEIVKNYRIINDKFEHATNIFSKSSDGAKIKLNIKITDDQCILRLYSFYSASTWLFIDSISFLINGETYKIESINSANKQIGIGQGIAERTYTIVDNELLRVVGKIIDSKVPVEVRFHGNNEYFDFKLSKKNIAAMKETLALYQNIIE
jgi:hypothetical protein